MIAGVFERRSVAVVVVACVSIVGAVIGARLSSWAKHNPVAAAPPVSIGVSGKNAEAGPANAMGVAPVLKPALAAVVNISSSRIVKAPKRITVPSFKTHSFDNSLAIRLFVKCRKSSAYTVSVPASLSQGTDTF